MFGPITFDSFSRNKVSFGVIRQVFHGFYALNCVHMAAAISYYSLFSLFPMTLAFISMMGYILQTDAAEAQIAQQIGSFIPVSQELVISTIRGVVLTRNAAGVLATVGLLWASMSVFSSIRKAVNAAWGIRQPRPFLHDRLIDFGLMAGAGFLFLASVSASAFLGIARELSVLFYGEALTDGLFPWSLLTRTIPPTLTFFTFLFLYRFLPNAKVTFRDVWFGALLATIAFEVTKNIFVLYAQNVATFNLVYGSLGAIVALLVWMYVSALILLFGAAVAAVFQRTWGAGVASEWDALRYLRP